MKNKILLFFSIFIISVLIRLYYIGYESINPDAVNWHYRCQQFANGIKYLQLEKTYPHYHPGVTLCYIMTFPTEVYKQITNQVYNSTTYLTFNQVNSIFLVIVIAFLVALISLQLGIRDGVIFGIILNLEPFFFGNSKLIHLDTLLTLFLFLAFLYFKKYLEEESLKSLLFVSLFLALAFLTKSVAIVFLPIFILGTFLLSNKSKVKKSLILFGATLSFVYLLFPALWTSPIDTMVRIFKEADRVGVRTGHSQIFLGEFYDENEDPGVLFYPVVMLIKFSPLMIFGIVLLFIDIFKFIETKISIKKLLNFEVMMFLGYLVYFGIIIYSDKKIDRYLLILFPPLFYYLTKKFNEYSKFIVGFLLVNLASIIYFSPYQFLYYSPVLLNYSNVNNLVAQKSFGVGIYELKEYLLKNYGEKKLGFYDIKPMETMYPNSKVFDVRQTSASKVDIVILSVNEKLPENYSNFYKKESFMIKGIPLYDVYLKN